MSSRFRKENQGFTGFSREILESPFTVDVQNGGAAFMPFGTKQLRFYISPERVYIDFFAELVHRFGFFIAANSKGQVRRFCEAKDTVQWTVSGAMWFRQRRNGAERRRASPFFRLSRYASLRSLAAHSLSGAFLFSTVIDDPILPY